jgi:cytochrome c-type biogenesis protein CcmH
LPEACRRAAVALVLVLATLAAANPAEDAEYLKAATTILCDCGCHPQSVQDCACGRAAEMRAELAGLRAQGLDGDAIIARYVAARGEQIRIAPVARGFNLVAWLGPLLVLVGATVVVAWLARRWSRTRGRADEPAPAPIDPLPEEALYRERLRQALEDRS